MNDTSNIPSANNADDLAGSAVLPAATPEQLALAKSQAEANARLQKIRRTTIPMAHISDDENAALLASIIQDVSHVGMAIHYTVDLSADWDVNNDLAIIPLPVTVGDGETKKQVNRAILIGCVPSAQATRDAPNGAAWVDALVCKAHINRLANKARPLATKPDDDIDLPVTVADFLASDSRTGDSLEGFNFVSKTMVPALVKQGFTGLTVPIFRKVLEVAAYAEALYSTTSQDQWAGVLAMMVKLADDAGKPSAVMSGWIATRNQELAPVAAVLDLSGLSDALHVEPATD